MPLENEKIEVAEEKETEMPNVEELLKILLDVNLEQNRQTVTDFHSRRSIDALRPYLAVGAGTVLWKAAVPLYL